MTQRSTSADFVTAFATGWPENQPDIMVLSLTTAKGIQDFALNKEQALLIALPQAPEARRPDRHPQAAQLARNQVLQLIGTVVGAFDHGGQPSVAPDNGCCGIVAD